MRKKLWVTKNLDINVQPSFRGSVGHVEKDVVQGVHIYESVISSGVIIAKRRELSRSDLIGLAGSRAALLCGSSPVDG